MSLASELSVRLARNAEAVCRHYLSAGRRYGNYWIVGDTANNQGRTLYVHLTGTRAGRCTDAATGQYGDLLDLLRETCDLVDFLDVADEARQFLRLSRADASHPQQPQKPARTSRPSSERARRLFAMARPINKTLADRYLRQRGILWAARYGSLRFHPHCFYRDLETGKTSGLPALIAAVTDSAGTITGVHRTWLDPRGDGKAKVKDPRRALGGLLGNAVRFTMPAKGLSARASVGAPVQAMIAGEGIETILSLSQVNPQIPMVAALTANHLAAFNPPAGCERLYIAADADAAGRHGIEGLSLRARSLGILPLVLHPELGDFNEDLRQLGPARLASNLQAQLAPEDCV